ncbi:MAG TPA: hypothetical protein VMF89_32160, partial [Polyangiales bacterium]|nr:hypothetical protein [Polyangiales bacterium]
VGGQGVDAVMSGGTDRTLDYYVVALLLIVSCVFAAALSLTRDRDRQLLDWLSGYLRLMLACTMLLYGLCKLFPLQFHMPGPRALTMKIGELEPWEVMWLFMGVSLPYTVFAGLAEILGGALLLWRRTSLLGALILLIVMGNVALMDLCYDVDMKLYACHLVLAISVVLAPELPRLLRALLAPDSGLRAGARWQHVARFAIFLLFTGQTLHWCWTATQEGSGKHPLHGIWTVQSAADGGTCRAPQDWHTVAIQRGSFTTIDRDHTRKLYKLDAQKLDSGGVTLLDVDTNKAVATLSATAKNPQELLLAGDFAGEPFQLALRRSDDTRLTTHRFAWTHDLPPQPR